MTGKRYKYCSLLLLRCSQLDTASSFARKHWHSNLQQANFDLTFSHTHKVYSTFTCSYVIRMLLKPCALVLNRCNVIAAKLWSMD